MKILTTLSIFILLTPYVVFAVTQTHSLDLELSSAQYAYITDASQTGLDITGDITIEAWIKVESAPATNSWFTIAGKWGAGDPNNSYQMVYWNNSGTLRFGLFTDNGSGTTNISARAQTFTTATWYHVAAQFDASTGVAEFFVDGSSIGTSAGSAITISNGGASFTIGVEDHDVSPNRYFDGLVDDVRVWDDLRTGTEINDNKDNCSLSPSEANLQGWWHLNNGYLDETSNNNDLTAVNSPVFSTDVPYTCVAEAVSVQSEFWF